MTSLFERTPLDMDKLVVTQELLPCPLVAVVDAVRDYLPPDGIDAQELPESLHRAARAEAVIKQMTDGCNAVLGLVQLIQGRDDLPAQLRVVLIDNHRVNEAKAAVRAAAQWQGREGEG